MSAANRLLPNPMTGNVLTLNETQRQLLRYAAIGTISNAAVYAGYLLLTGLGAGHKLAMTIVYCAGTLATFMFNRRWTFGHGGAPSGALARYIATYAGGYVFNAIALMILVDRLGLPHRPVMLVLILVTACMTFLLQKFWVFAGAGLAPGRGET